MTIHPREAWTEVADHIASRSDKNPSAGDNSRFIRLQDRVFVHDVFSRMRVDDRSVLEVGCGPGGKLCKVLEIGRPRRLVGADITPRMAELSTARFSDQDVEIVQLEPGEAYPFADREFDTVFTCTVLHHNPREHLPAIVEQLARVCGGELWLFEATTDGREISSGNFHLRRVAYYQELLAVHGFQLHEQIPVRVALSNRVASAAQRLAHTRRLGRAPYSEGAPVDPVRKVIEGALLPLTSRIDPFVSAPTGLRGMRFERV